MTLDRISNLVKKGMVYSPSNGVMALTVPLFDEFMRRAMPMSTGGFFDLPGLLIRVY